MKKTESVTGALKLTDINTIQNEATLPDEETTVALKNIVSKQPEFLEEELAFAKAKTRKAEIYNECLQQEKEWRGRLGWSIFIGVAIYIVYILHVVTAQPSNHLSDKILMMLIGSTTLGVLGLLAIVLRFVFSDHHHRAHYGEPKDHPRKKR